MTRTVEWCTWPRPKIGGVAIITMADCGVCGSLEWWLEPFTGMTICGHCYPFIPRLLEAKQLQVLIDTIEAERQGVITIVFSHNILDRETMAGGEKGPADGLVNCSIEGQILVTPLEVSGPYELDVAEILRLRGVAIQIGGQRWSLDLPEEGSILDVQWSKEKPPVVGGGAHCST